MMKFTPKTEADKILADKLEKGKLVVFCGAGVSLEPPAGLPDWKGLRDESINIIANKMLEFVPYIRDLKTHIPELERNAAEMLGIDIEKDGIPQLEDIREIAENPESFIAELEKIASTLTEMQIYGELPAELVVSEIYKNSKNYFEILKVMDEGEPNTNHKYFAKLAKNGKLKWIVTTNWDKYIERALEAEGIKYKVYRTKEDFINLHTNLAPLLKTSGISQEPDNIVRVLKIHGCIDDPDSIVALVEQQAAKEKPAFKWVLEELMRNYWFVFWGYSGSDLRFDLDYLGHLTAKQKKQEKKTGFIWNFMNNETNKYVENLFAKYKEFNQESFIVHGKLPEIFDFFIAENDQIIREKYTTEQQNNIKEARSKVLRTYLSNWAKDNLSIGQASNLLAVLLKHTGKVEFSLNSFITLEIQAIKEKRKQYLATSFNNIGEIHRSKSTYPKALDFYQKALKIVEKLGIKKDIAKSFNNIGSIYLAKDKFDEALEYYQKSLKMFEEIGDQASLAVSLNNLGAIYKKIGKHKIAIEYYQKALQIQEEIGDRTNMATSFNNIGSIYDEKEDYQKALEYYQKSLQIKEEIGDRAGLAISFNNIGEIHRAKVEYEKALEYYKKDLAILKKSAIELVWQHLLTT